MEQKARERKDLVTISHSVVTSRVEWKWPYPKNGLKSATGTECAHQTCQGSYWASIMSPIASFSSLVPIQGACIDLERLQWSGNWIFPLMQAFQAPETVTWGALWDDLLASIPSPLVHSNEERQSDSTPFCFQKPMYNYAFFYLTFNSFLHNLVLVLNSRSWFYLPPELSFLCLFCSCFRATQSTDLSIRVSKTSM